jgi:hypothetical protein
MHKYISSFYFSKVGIHACILFGPRRKRIFDSFPSRVEFGEKFQD